MRHTEVAQAPCQSRCDRQSAVTSDIAGLDIASLEDIEESVKVLNVGENVLKSLRAALGKSENDYERDRHDDALDEVGRGSSKETAQCAVKNDNGSRDEHRLNIIHSEHRRKELAACGESRCRVRNEENNDDYCRKQCEKMLVVTESFREEVRDRDGVDLLCVNTKSFRNEKPVEICSDGKSDSRPGRFCKTCYESKSGKSQKEPRAHVRCLGTHRRYERAQTPSAEIEIISTFVGLAEVCSDADHHEQIQRDRNQYANS